ncbi:MAG: CBS domain-containing protein [Acidobacteriota bacterium]
MNCPSCGHDNIAGADLCEMCGSDLAGLDLPESHRGFRGRLLTGHIKDLAISTSKSTVAEAVQTMRDQQHGSVMVIDDGELTGIFTERDVLTKVIRSNRDPATTLVSDVMTPNPITLDINDPPAFAIHLSVAGGLRHLPVVAGGEVKGLISVRDLLRHIHEDVLGT